MWPLLGLLLLVGGAALSKKRKDQDAEGGSPLEELPSPADTAAQAVAAAEGALEAASAGDNQGTPSGAQQAATAAQQAATAAQQAAGTDAGALVAQIAAEVQKIAAAAAQKTGTPTAAAAQPPTRVKTEVDGQQIDVTSPGIPQFPGAEEDEEEQVVVESGVQPPGPPKTAPQPATPGIFQAAEEAAPAAGVPASVTQAVKDAAAGLKIPVALPTSKAEEPPLAKAEVEPIADPNGTIALARMMLEREQSSGWRGALSGPVTIWQGKIGTTADGKFGTGSAAKMANEVGILPRVRFWPKGSPTKASALQKYRNDMNTKAANLQSQGKKEHAEALRVSALAEDARAFGNTNPAPVAESERLDQLEALTERVA